jgi:hypothetical protein
MVKGRSQEIMDEGDEQGSQVKISDEPIGRGGWTGVGRDKSKEDRFDVVFGDRVWCLRQEDGIIAQR